MKQKRAAYGRGGFTLIELLVAIAVLGVSLTLVLGIHSSVFSVVEQVDKNGSLQNRSALLIDQLQRDFHGIYKGTSGFLRAEPIQDPRGDTPLLEFTTSSILRFKDSVSRGSIALVRYTLTKSKINSSYNLYRTEIPFLFGLEESEFEEPVTILVCAHVAAVRLSLKDRYGAFVEGWEARSSALREGPDDSRFPSLVRIEIELADGEGRGDNKTVSQSVLIAPWQLIGTRSGGS
jgi:prepilin-type N-terminal cleavage/methylation domain-containing protein